MSNEILDKINVLIEEKRNIFVTGGAGTGKSYILNKLREKYKDKLHITSTTGISAINVNGQTIHSWAGIGIGNKPVEETIRKIKSNGPLYRKFILCDMLAIDEISMLDNKTLDYISDVLKGVRCINKPFGYIQVLFFGDFFQLPPVRSNVESKNFCFNSKTWKELDLVPIILNETKRQSDEKLISVLNNIRLGKSTNTKLFYEREVSSVDAVPSDILRIFGTNSNADFYNLKCFSQIKTQKFVYEAKDELYCYDSEDKSNIGIEIYKNPSFSDKAIPFYDLNLYKQFNENCKAPFKLELKQGCRVMLLHNINVEKGLANGTCGTVIDLNEDYIKVKFDNEIVEVIEPVDFEYKKDGDKKIKRTQYPLRLAYGITIHKSQGMTFDKLVVDFSKIFDYGQAYVALSRTRTLNGLYIYNFDPRKIIASDEVVEFYKELAKVNQEIL